MGKTRGQLSFLLYRFFLITKLIHLIEEGKKKKHPKNKFPTWIFFIYLKNKEKGTESMIFLPIHFQMAAKGRAGLSQNQETKASSKCPA